MIIRRGKITMRSTEVTMIDPQCFTCNYSVDALECEVGFIPDGNIFLNKMTCLEYEQINDKYS